MVFQVLESHRTSFYLIFYLGKALGLQTPNHWFYDNDVRRKAITHYAPCHNYMYAGVGVLVCA